MAIRTLQSYSPNDASRQENARLRGRADDASNAERDPYAHPTGFTSFQQQYDANAGTANKAAGHLADLVSGGAKQATDTEQGNYDAYANAVQAGTHEGGAEIVQQGDGSYGFRGNSYAGPTDPYVVSGAAQSAANKASEQSRLLGSTSGTQAVMGPATSMFGAALAHHALAPQQHALASQAAAAQTLLAGDPAKAQHALTMGRARSAPASPAQQEAERLRLTADFDRAHPTSGDEGSGGSQLDRNGPSMEDLWLQQQDEQNRDDPYYVTGNRGY